MRPRTLLALTLALAPAPSLAAVPGAFHPQEEDDIEALVAAERAEADLVRRRGDYSEALAITDELLLDDEEDALTLSVRARVRLDQGDLPRAERTAAEALELAVDDGERAAAGRVLGEVLIRAGRAGEVLERLEAARVQATFLAPGSDPRDAWLLASVQDALGDRAGAARFARSGASTDPDANDWTGLLAKGRCQRRAGMLRAASQTIVAADRAAQKAAGVEPDVLTELADLYFESEREVEAPGKRSAGELYREALEIHSTHEGALLGLFALHRYNRRRVSRSPEAILAELLAAVPDSVRGLVASAAADLDDGKLVGVRETLARLDELAPARRDVRTMHAALAWVEHDRDRTAEILEELLSGAPSDSAPEREIGGHLSELYRFAEAVDFLEAAVQRDPEDYEAWTLLGECLANTGDDDGAREALRKAKAAASGRRDAFRANLALVLERMDRAYVTESFGSLEFSWQPDAAEVLRTYLVPYYQQAREELAKRYGHTPGPTTIAVFREHRDFSVRSVGFEGFPALGVCFGPVVTAVSPLSGLRGSFSWARTGFHEFSHVIHLGLSNNRCPRWITEGLATWEEIQRNPTWTRNMRRDLVDAYANDDLIPLRELNRAFRGPRILFGYYQGGLLCEMLIDEHGFAPMVALLQAFDLGADLDQAFNAVFDTTPEEVDADFLAFVGTKVESLAIEPRWSRKTVRRLQIVLSKDAPDDVAELDRWADDWATVAWGAWQEGRSIDAEQALQVLATAGAEPLRATFLRGHMAAADTRMGRARTIWEDAVRSGGREYRSLLALSQLQQGGVGGDRDIDAARHTLELAIEAFPGYGGGTTSAEKLLSGLYRSQGDEDEAMRWLEEWTRWNAGEYDARVEVAEWHVEAGRDEEAVRLFEEANEVDLFRRDLHIAWAEALRRLERHEEALREFQVALAVPARLDPDHIEFVGDPTRLPPGANPKSLPPALLGQLPEEMLRPVPLSDDERADLLDAVAECAEAIGKGDVARDARAQKAAIEASR
ncbi:MAG: tetratricopeptide repeat protein [Planctomycetota bacterium]